MSLQRLRQTSPLSRSRGRRSASAINHRPHSLDPFGRWLRGRHSDFVNPNTGSWDLTLLIASCLTTFQVPSHNHCQSRSQLCPAWVPLATSPFLVPKTCNLKICCSRCSALRTAAIPTIAAFDVRICLLISVGGLKCLPRLFRFFPPRSSSSPPC